VSKVSLPRWTSLLGEPRVLSHTKQQFLPSEVRQEACLETTMDRSSSLAGTEHEKLA
jgi:hypothetical protein